MTPNKPDLVLHIGTEKTGTTTIQNFLKANRDQLRRQSVYVSKDLMIPSGNQRWLAALAYNATRIDELISTQGYRSKAERDQDMVNRYERLKQEIEASTSDCKRWIISSEHLQSRLTTDEEIHRLYQLLKELFNEITIVLYIRNPVDTAISLLSMFCVYGDVLEQLPEPSQRHVDLICNHARILEQWQKNYPKTKNKQRLFEIDRLNEGDLIKDFCGQARITPGADWNLKAQHSNERLTLKGMRYLHHLNGRFPPLVHGNKNPERGNLAAYVHNFTKQEEPFRITLEQKQAYEQHYAESNETIRGRYFPNQSTLWSEKTRQYADSTIKLSDIDNIDLACLKMFAEVWATTQQQSQKIRTIQQLLSQRAHSRHLTSNGIAPFP